MVSCSQLKPKYRGLSLVEALLVIATIGIVAAISIPIFGNIRDAANKAAATQNAKTVASMSEALAALGVAHVTPDSLGGAEATARLLREGVIVPEGPFAGERFILSGISDEDIEEVGKYLMIQYDTTELRVVFVQPEDQTLFRDIEIPQILIAGILPFRHL